MACAVLHNRVIRARLPEPEEDDNDGDDDGDDGLQQNDVINAGHDNLQGVHIRQNLIRHTFR